MTTRLQVSETTMEILKKLKKRYGLKSYDEAIKRLAGEAMHQRGFLLGTLEKRSKAEILQGLRDEEDRF